MNTQAIQIEKYQKALPINTDEAVNTAIKENELKADDWALRDLAEKLYSWVDLFNLDFFKDKPAPLPVLTFERARVNNLGSYRIGRNDWGVKQQINLNSAYLDLPLWHILATLLHEQTHSYEHTYFPENERTKTWYHTKSFRRKMAEFGILCNEKGVHEGIIAGGMFYTYLKNRNVSLEGLPEISKQQEDSKTIIPIEPKKKIKGKSKLLKWSCSCTNIRAAVKVNATCNKCGNNFELQT